MPEPEEKDNSVDQESQDSEPKQLREISDKELERILEEHEKWVESGGKEGKQADLSYTNLAKKNLRQVDLTGAELVGTDLTGANLEEANLFKANLALAILKEASLLNSNLNESNLAQADLSHANLRSAVIKKSCLISAQCIETVFDDSNLSESNLSRAKLIKAALRYVILKESDLTDANLFSANLSNSDCSFTAFYDTNLQNAYFLNSSLENAILSNVNICGTSFNGANFMNASFYGTTDFEEVDLRDCNLENARGLKATNFARSDLTGVSLPSSIGQYRVLGIVAENTKIVRRLFLIMLLACTYSWLILLSTSDTDLFTNAPSSPIPNIDTAIPIAWFYLNIPVLLLGLYLYFHLYLRRYWSGLAKLPAIFEDGLRLDELSQPWLLNGLVRRHFRKIRYSRNVFHRIEEWISIFLAWYVIPITCFSFWLRYILRHDWTGTYLHIFCVILAVIVGYIFYKRHSIILKGIRSKRIHWKNPFRDKRITAYLYIAIFGALIITLSYGAINGVKWEDSITEKNILKRIVPKVFGSMGYDVFADFREQDISQRPENYWLLDSAAREISIIGASLAGVNLKYADAYVAFLKKADIRYADLTGANLWGANLQRANLRFANFQRAYLGKVDLKEANLHGTNFKAADLSSTKNLTKEQLDLACGDSLTILPDYLGDYKMKPCPCDTCDEEGE